MWTNQHPDINIVSILESESITEVYFDTFTHDEKKRGKKDAGHKRVYPYSFKSHHRYLLFVLLPTARNWQPATICESHRSLFLAFHPTA